MSVFRCCLCTRIHDVPPTNCQPHYLHILSILNATRTLTIRAKNGPYKFTACIITDRGISRCTKARHAYFDRTTSTFRSKGRIAVVHFPRSKQLDMTSDELTEQPSWTVVPCGNHGDVPPIGAGHACVLYKDSLYIFGSRTCKERGTAAAAAVAAQSFVSLFSLSLSLSRYD